MSRLIQMPKALEERSTFGFFDDFEWMVTVHRWTSLEADSSGGAGTGVYVSDAAGGRCLLTPADATDNDEVALFTSKEVFLFAADKPAVWEFRGVVAQSGSAKLNFLFGVLDAIGANVLIDDGGGPKASYSGACFFVEDGQTLWSVESSIAGTQTTTQLTATNSLDKVAHTAGSSTAQVLRIEFLPFSSTQADLLFYIDGVLVAKHLFTYTSATEMMVGASVKNGSTTPEVACYADYIAAYQAR